MVKRRNLRMMLCVASLSLSIISCGWVAYSMSANAYDITDELGSSSSVTSGSGSSGSGADDFLNQGDISSDDREVADFLKNQRGVTGEQLQEASDALSPITNAIGWVSGAIIALISLGIFLITAVDLLYISIPPIRTFLYTPGTDGTGAMTAGRGYGGFGGYGGYGAYGGANMNQQQKRKIQWVSDECIRVCALMGGSSATEGMGAMSRYGGYNAQPQQQMSRGSLIIEYLKKRAIFIIFFAVCILVLTSSVLMGFGVNVAQWGIKIISAISSAISL